MGVLCRLEEFEDQNGVISATRISTHVIDMTNSATFRDVGIDPPWLVVLVRATGTGSGSLTIALVSGGDVALQTTPVVHYTSPAFVGTDMVAGTEIVKVRLPNVGSIAGVPSAAPNMKRYLGLQFTVSGTVGAVKLTAGLTKDAQSNTIYAAAGSAKIS
jgi:hypothetical protein